MKGLLGVMLLGVSLLFAQGAMAYTHHTSPIQWNEYSDRAFSKAQKESKPIFMLISAVWCYSCHIYEETLNTKEIVETLNKHFVPVFVDFDRRKDIARTYSAVGIPVTSILAPNGEHLVSVPGVIAKDTLLTNLQLTLEYIAKEYQPMSSGPEEKVPLQSVKHPTSALIKFYIDSFDNNMFHGFDLIFGGYGLAQKEPFADLLLELLRLEEKGNEKWQEPLQITMDAMLGMTQTVSESKRPSFDRLLTLREQQTVHILEVEELQLQNKLVGIYDHTEGGFFRYATRRDWTVPHFEKMLFENAQLIELLLQASVQYGHERYQAAAHRSLSYLLENLYSGEDGRFLGSQGADAVYYHLTATERAKVLPPPVDQTSYAGASARTIITLLKAWQILEDKYYLASATQGADFLAAKMITENGSYSYFDAEEKTGQLSGQLIENAWVAVALLQVYDVMKTTKYLAAAERVLTYASENLYDPQVGGFVSRRGASQQAYRQDERFLKDKNFNDNGIMAKAMFKAYEMTGNEAYLNMVETTVGYFFNEVMAGKLKAASPEFHWVAQQMLRMKKYQ